LKKELSTWYWNDTIEPLAAPLATVLLIKISLQFFLPGFQLNLLLIGFIFAVTFAVSVWTMPDTRVFIKRFFQNLLVNGREG